MLKTKEIARLFYIEIRKIDEQEAIDILAKTDALYQLINLVFVDITREERIQFSTLFARIAYACQKHLVSKQQQFYIHTFRKEAKKLAIANSTYEANELYQFGLKVVGDTISELYNENYPNWLQKIIPDKYTLEFSSTPIAAFRSKARVVILDDDPEVEQLIGRDEEKPDEDIRIQYAIADRNENFNPSIQAIRKIFGYPVLVNLLDIEIDENGVYRPKGFVIEPDYLVDVTSIAECFMNIGAEPIVYLLKKYLPFENSIPLMLGNIANFFLDELMTNPEVTFKELFPKVFRLNPLAFTLFDNREVREIMQKSQKHYVNLKKMVMQGFGQVGIANDDCFLEPSFYSEKYGIQGRLDVFYKNPDNEQEAAIIELKSGKTFAPNRYGINHNHYTQTLLYDLIIKSTFGSKTNPTNYILYSGLDERNLRYAPATKAQQMEAIQLRNQLVAIERKMTDLSIESDALIRRLSLSRLPKASGFLRKNIAQFESAFNTMTLIERAYMLEFSAFIAREQQLAKTGIEGIEKINGLASLWRSNFRNKQDRFEILAYLEIIENQAKAEEPIIIFKKTEQTDPLANFRKGDIAVLYPFEHQGTTVLNDQIFKCSIIEVDKYQVKVKLRSKQFNNSIFVKERFWNLEHDMMDSAFTGMYRGLFAFTTSPARKKHLLLTKIAPEQVEPANIECPDDLTDEQQQILKKIIASKDYFLLWGPPGTGKTSKMLRSMVDHLVNQTEENILLLAYTNRAVDEICEAIEQIAPEQIKDQYIRIGSKYSTGVAFQDQLLDAKIKDVHKRADLKNIIDHHRIFVATVASIASKPDLMKLKHFNTVIIDEASQILEPLLVGLLPKFDRFILIGDHQQLPAVVMQDQADSQVKDELLHQIGLTNLRNALFERLYLRCMENGWDWAYANLSHQGRMHEDIMMFPNEHFYTGKLRILPESIPFHLQQTRKLEYAVRLDNHLVQQLTTNRVLYIPTSNNNRFSKHKTNESEANKIVELVKAFKSIYQSNTLDFHAKTLGIITPYRAQIAQIRSALEAQEIDPDLVTIDTVERYQGGARDIILISLCTNSVEQLESMISLSEEGVDRKLNVALTRARQHLVILGNPDILRTNPIYSKLMDSYPVLGEWSEVMT